MSSKSGNADAKRRKKYSNRKSCFHCHRLHLSCDGGRPCSRCVKGERAASCISSDEEQFNLAGKCVKDSDQNLLKMDRTNFELKSEIQRLKFQIETLRSKVESVPFVENSRSFEFPIGNSSTTVLSFREDVMLESVESQRLSNLDSFEWDTFYPDFFSKRSEGISLKRNEDVQKLHSSIWNPSISVASQFEEVSKPFSSQINYPFSITSESFNQTHTKLLKDDEVSLVEKAKQILVSLGATNHYMKIKLYAHCVTFRGRLVLCNDEFLKLCRTDHREDVLGRSIKDFNPPAMNQLNCFMFHREMLASRSSSITYETIFARCDGSLYRCFVNRVLSFDQFNRLGQEHYTIHLNTVEDLIEVPRLEQSLPRQTPGISLEVDYPPEESSLELIES